MLPAHPLPEGFNWLTTEFIGELHDAIARRLAADGSGNDALLAQLQPPEVVVHKRDFGEQAGFNRMTETVVDTETGATIFNLSIRSMQEAVFTLCNGSFYREDPLAAFTSQTLTNQGYNFNNQVPQVSFWSFAQITADLGLDPGWNWTRKHPRFIYSLDDPGEAGQRARRVSGPVQEPNANVFAEVYEHDGSAWVEITDDPVAMPDELEDQGLAEVGDYIGPWIWNELLTFLSYLTVCRVELDTVPSTTNEVRTRSIQFGTEDVIQESTSGISSPTTGTGWGRSNFGGPAGNRPASEVESTVAPRFSFFPAGFTSTAVRIKLVEDRSLHTLPYSPGFNPFSSTDWTYVLSRTVAAEQDFEEFSLMYGDRTDQLPNPPDLGRVEIDLHRLTYVGYIDDTGTHEEPS